MRISLVTYAYKFSGQCALLLLVQGRFVAVTWFGAIALFIILKVAFADLYIVLRCSTLQKCATSDNFLVTYNHCHSNDSSRANWSACDEITCWTFCRFSSSLV